MIVDGIDQAKFRIPRVLQKTHALDRLLRPALHVQGAWCHGFGYHLAVADADMPKDTNNNIEVIARLLSHIYLSHHGLPL
jgi:Fe-S cluster assembly iron-binding protein IscA